MKDLRTLIFVVGLAWLCLPLYSQNGKVVLNTNEIPEKTHVHVDDFPKGQNLPMIHGWGGLSVDINNAPAGTDFTPLLEGLENDHCQVAHWGYIIKGSIKIQYEDGPDEIFSEGEAFYMRPGHTAVVKDDLLLVSFSPEEGMKDLQEHLEKKLAEMKETSNLSNN